MTRPYRRDKGTTKAAVIAGLRMEADLAQRLSAYARENFEGNVAAAARHVLRVGLDVSVDESLQREEQFSRIAMRRRAEWA